MYPNEVLLVKNGRFFARKRCSHLNMESKGLQNRKAERERRSEPKASKEQAGNPAHPASRGSQPQI